MAIGRTFQESLQKALRSMETGLSGLDPVELPAAEDEAQTRIRRELQEAGPDRLLFVAEAFRRGLGFDEIHRLSRIDPWFLDQIAELIEQEAETAAQGVAGLTDERFAGTQALRICRCPDCRAGESW